MHISDGFLSPQVSIAGYAAALTGTGFACYRFDERRIPQVAVMTSLFFVASSISVPLPLGITSWHFMLNGLVGMVLGWDAVPAILLSLLLQYLLLGEGGIASLGVNTVTMAGGALVGFHVFRLRRGLKDPLKRDAFFALLASAAALVASGVLFYLAMALSDPQYRTVTLTSLGLETPLLAIEPALTASVVIFLAKVKPELLLSRETAR